ncbi:exported hypothetical protein [groundwater metagenome]|uniref:Uncharacterized protein n=1 Tax=groundwater metagenome TaxID=717931 RepID=A0A098EET6_9ZZZZ
MDKLKTGILVMLVGMAIIGMTVSSVSAGDALCKSIGIPSLNGYKCTIDTGSSCVCGNIYFPTSQTAFFQIYETVM